MTAANTNIPSATSPDGVVSQTTFQTIPSEVAAKPSPQEIAEIEAQMYADAVHNMQIGIYIWQLEECDRNASHQNNRKSKDSNDDRNSTLRLISTNAAASRFTGVASEGLIGQTIEEIFPVLGKTDIPSIYKTVARTGKGQNLGEVTYGDDRVSKGIFSVKAFPLRRQCVGVAFENITARKQTEKAHLENEEQLRIIFEQASVGMARLSPDGQWIQVNQRLCNILGYPMPELLKKTFVDITHPDDLESDQKAYQNLQTGEASQITLEKRYITRSGDTVWANVTVSTVRECSANTPHPEKANRDSSKLLYFIATIQNITQRKKAAIALQKQKNDLLTVNLMLTDTMAQLEQRNEELDQFAYVTSHDLKAPLRAIVNLATWIEEDIGSTLPAENKEQFALLKSRVHRMEGLINGLLDYSRVDRTHQSHERLDITELLHDIIDSISPPSAFNIELAPNLPVLEAKKTPLRQVFANLITNAVKHHDRSNGNIRISAREAGNFYEFAVSDDGPGIDPTYHEKIFVIFQTLKARDDLESTGIGLSLVKKIILAENGCISVESELGQGTTFTFTWPKSPYIGIQIT